MSQLCPTRPQSDEEFTATARKQSESDPEFQKAKALIAQALRKQVRLKREDDRFLLESLHQNLEFKDPKARAYLRLMKTADSPSQYVRLNDDGDLDVEAIKKAMLKDHRPPEDIEMTIRYYQQSLALDGNPNSAFSDYDTLRSTLSESELKERLLGGLKELEQAADQLSRVTGLPREILDSESSAKENRKQIEEGTISEGRFNDIKNLLNSYRFKLQLYAHPERWGNETGSKLTLRDILPANIEERLKMQIAVADNLLSDDDMANQESPYFQALNRVYLKCTSALTEGYAMSPSAEQLQKFKANEAVYRSEFGKKSGQFLSAKSAAAVARLSETWKTKLPPQRDAFLQAFSERVASEAEYTSVGELARNTTGKTREFAITELVQSDSLRDDEEYFDSMNRVCTSEVPQAYGDLTPFKKESVTVSARTVVRTDYAKHILFHEYSHLLSTAIRNSETISSETKTWYNSFRKCLEEQRGSKKRFTEEDFAVSLAYALAPETPTFSCDKETPLTKDAFFTLGDSSNDKEHSGPLYNLVLGIFARGGDFKDCRAALAEIGEKEIPENCFEKVKPAAAAAK